MATLPHARALTPSPSPQGSGEFGYNLVVLIVAIAVLNILIAAMLPLWSTAIRREKEEELVFRGLQYAEAIRVFHKDYQRYPNKLEELLEIKPRCIRQLWKDPMTEDGKWALIFQNQLQPIQPQPTGNGKQKPPKGPRKGDEEDDNGRPQFGPAKGDVVQIGPIIGVHSKSGEKSMLLFFGHERYDEWQFTENIIPSGGMRPSGPVNPTTDLSMFAMNLGFSTRWVGRPMRFMSQLPGDSLLQGGTMPDGSRPGSGKPGNKPGPRSPKQPSTPQ
jgi:type II secretory pathway pseudopilin PulG